MVDPSRGNTPLELLGAVGMSVAELRPGLRLIEVFTMQRLLKLLWFGDPAAADVTVFLPGGMGGFTGPARAGFMALADRQIESGRGGIVVDYRKPGDLDRSLLDTCATIDWAMREGGRRFAVVGHSFGGAVAVQTGTTIGGHCVGVVTLATQSAGCEVAALLGEVPLLLLHGDHDSILRPDNSAIVRQLAGHGDLRIIEGAGHGLEEARDHVLEVVAQWLDDRFGEPPIQIASQP